MIGMGQQSKITMPKEKKALELPMPPEKLIKSKFLTINLSLGWHGSSRTKT